MSSPSEQGSSEIAARLEELRAVLRSESISWGELAELQRLAEHIEAGDVELLEAAGVPEFPEATFHVDIPNPAEPQGAWVEVATFDSKEEALTFATEFFGADAEGRISLVSEVGAENGAVV